MIVINMTAFMFYHSDRLGGSLDSPLARAVFKPLYRMKWQRLIISMLGKDDFCFTFSSRSGAFKHVIFRVDRTTKIITLMHQLMY